MYFVIPSSLLLFAGEFGLQPEPSLVLSQLVQRHSGPSLPLARQPSPPMQQQAAPASASPAPQHISTPAQAGPVTAAAGAKPGAPSPGLDSHGSSTPQQQRGQLKGPKRRIPPTSKVGVTVMHREKKGLLLKLEGGGDMYKCVASSLADPIHSSRNARLS